MDAEGHDGDAVAAGHLAIGQGGPRERVDVARHRQLAEPKLLDVDAQEHGQRAAGEDQLRRSGAEPAAVHPQILACGAGATRSARPRVWR